MGNAGTKRWSIILLAASLAGVAAAYGACFVSTPPPLFTVPAMIVSIATMLLSIMMLGASRGGGVGRLIVPFIAVWALLIVGFMAAFWLPAETVSAPHLLLGIPRRSALILYGIGILPLLGMPLAYAFTFDEFTLSEAELMRLRAAASKIIEQEQSGAP